MKTANLNIILGSALVATLAVASVGCGHVGMLKEAAAADLNCEPRRVHVLNGGKTRDVEACGQRATYRWEDGDWRMVGRSGAPPAGQPQPAPKAGPQPVIVQPPAQTAPGSMPPSMPPSQPPPSSGTPGRSL